MGDTGLKGRTAIVTGGGKGIGSGIALELAREGANVVVADVDTAAAEEVAAIIRSEGSEALVVGTDVSSEDAVKQLIAATVERFGGIDVVVNNAGLGVYNNAVDTTVEELDRALSVNVRGGFLVTKHAVPHLTESAHAAVVNVASVHGVQNVGGTLPYAVTKGGIIAMTRATAIDLAPRGIRVNAVCPGWVDTPLVQSIFDEADDPAAMRASVEKRQLLGRLGTPRDIGRAAVFLAGDDSTYMTGSNVFVDAGMTAVLETWFD